MVFHAEIRLTAVALPLIDNSWMHRGSHRSAGGPCPQHVARSSWSGAFLSLSTSYAAADRAGPRSGGGDFMRPTGLNEAIHP